MQFVKFSQTGRINSFIKVLSMRLTRIHLAPALVFCTPAFTTELALPLAASPISAGFPSPAEEFDGQKLNLNDELIKHPEATFYARVKGHSMIDAGIEDVTTCWLSTRRLSRRMGI